MSGKDSNTSSAVRALQNDFASLKKAIEGLQKDVAALQGNVSISGGFSNTMDHATLQQAILDDLLKVNEYALSYKGITTYVLPSLNVQLKAFVTTDKSGKLVYALPTKPGEFDSNSLSTITLPFVAIPSTPKETISSPPISSTSRPSTSQTT